MNRHVLAVALATLSAFGLAMGLSYVECSSGFQNNPALDGGRTELEFADVNNDGNIDIISIGDHGSPYINTQEHGVMVWFGNGQGGWTVFQYGEFGYGGIAVGDVNGDGKWDIGYGMHHNYSGVDLGDQVMEVALGDGTGQMWTAWDDSMAQEGQDWGMFSTDFADIDNDGDLDVGGISFGADDGIHVYLNLGNGAWRRSFGFTGGNSQMEFYFRDVNRDGNADMIAAHGTGSIWLGDGAGGFTPADTGLPASSGGLDGLSVGDVDNDGGCDVAFANSDGGVEVWSFDDASGVWLSVSGTLPSSGDFDGTQLCDMNADGFTDLVALGGGHTKVWLGDGQGNWTEAADITTADGTYAALRAGADFDHNGLPDLAFVTREGSWPNDYNRAHAFRESSVADSLGVFPVFPRGGEKFANGSVQFVDWWSSAPTAESTEVKIELSTTGRSGPWLQVADSLPNAGRYQWLVPDSIKSADCFVKYTVFGSGGSVEELTPHAFAIGDTMPGVAETHTPQPSIRDIGPSIVRDVLVLGAVGSRQQTADRVELLDVSGRKVLDLLPGANDVRALAPGVYFVRTAQAQTQAQAPAVRKVVLTR
ncbi:MAG: VCBS repeat-containing protein [Sedimentisphaerales bacterium]|nr:VCBS repeat-containing protein [Sedimentisphaerales bacterium]